jgi:hypothetical protein
MKVKPKSDTTNMTSLLRSDQDQREEMEFKRRVRRRAKKRAACSFVSGSSYIHTYMQIMNEAPAAVLLLGAVDQFGPFTPQAKPN